MSAATAATAVGFDASLPEAMTDEQLERLVKWGKESCEKSDLFMKEGKLHLIAIRKEPKTARQFQSLLRTSLSNWGVELPSKMVGWLELVSPKDFETRRQEPYQKTQAETPEIPEIPECRDPEFVKPWSRIEWTIRTHPQEILENGVLRRKAERRNSNAY